MEDLDDFYEYKVEDDLKSLTLSPQLSKSESILSKEESKEESI